MQIDIRQIPDEGLLLEGEESSAMFDLDEDAFRPASPLRYRLHASFQDSELLLQGSLEAAFDMRCDRCLEFFRKTIRLDPYSLLEPVEKPGIIDLTDRLREDILLDLPGYPKCEQADATLECAALSRVNPKSRHKAPAPPESEKNVWKALDDFQPEKDQNSPTPDG